MVTREVHTNGATDDRLQWTRWSVSAATLIAIQEPSPDQAWEMQQDLLTRREPLAVRVLPCSPDLWGPGRPASPREGRHGQQWDGNGFIWNTTRLELATTGVGLESFWLSPTPDVPSSAQGAWAGASEFCRMATVATFVDVQTRKTVRAFSVHFDHTTPTVKIQSAHVLMERVKSDVSSGDYDCVVVFGDFNTFTTERGETYRGLVAAAGGMVIDIRGVGDRKTHRADDTWAHWPGSGDAGGRFDHIFTSSLAAVVRTAVVEDDLPASDHRPVVAEIVL
eukprot:COSAG01_NODE_3563_length_5927_cov_6.552239_5_plen_279_part_00